jgi:hypothetical protein
MLSQPGTALRPLETTAFDLPPVMARNLARGLSPLNSQTSPDSAGQARLRGQAGALRSSLAPMGRNSPGGDTCYVKPND